MQKQAQPSGQASKEAKAPAQPAEAGTPQPVQGATQPTPVFKGPGDPAIFIVYKAENPTGGKEYKAIDLKVGEEIIISVQALDKGGLDTGACPVEWKGDPGILSVKAVEGNCKAAKIKALKRSDSVTLTTVYKGAKGNNIEPVLTMKIAYLSETSIPSTAANSIHVMKMCKAFSEQGCKLVLLVPKTGNHEVSDEDSFEFYGVAPSFTIVRVTKIPLLGHSTSYGIRCYRNLFHIQPDVVFSRSFMGSLAAVYAGFPTMYEFHQPIS
jgi:hypothetical protein